VEPEKCLFFGAAFADAVSETCKVLGQGGNAPALAGCLDVGSWMVQASFSDAKSDVLARHACSLVSWSELSCPSSSPQAQTAIT